MNNEPQKQLIIVIGSLEVGGAERHLSYVLPKLQATGWSIRVITLHRKGSLAPVLEAQGIAVECMLSPRFAHDMRYWPTLLAYGLRGLRISAVSVNLIRTLHRARHPATILHFFLPEAYLLGMISAKLAGFNGPMVMSRRSLNHYQTRRPLLGRLEKILHPYTQAILGNSAAIINELYAQEHVPPEKLHLIYNGIELHHTAATAARDITRAQLSIPSDACVLIIVANLIPYKGHQDLLRALAEIQARITKPWTVLCVGRDDGIGPQLQQQAEQSGLAPHILWLGSRPDIPELLAAADIGILCSHEEGFSNALLEAMAQGLPMIVTDVGGNKEAVIDGETGYVVPARNPTALGAALLMCITHPEQAKLLGQRGQERVQRYFSIDGCVNAYDQLYARLWHNCATAGNNKSPRIKRRDHYHPF